MGIVHNTTTPDIETASENYRKRFAGAVGDYFLSVQWESVSSCLNQLGTGPLKILEVGGGHGQITEALLQAGHTVTVQGSTEETFVQLRPLTERYPGRLKFIPSSLWAIPAPDQSFDVVIALRLLAHIERWDELLTEMTRLAERQVIIDFPAKSALNVLTPLLFGLKKGIEGNTRPYFSYTKTELTAAFLRHGFQTTKTVRQFLFPMGLHRGLGRASISKWIENLGKTFGVTEIAGSPIILAASRH